jgi:hypothetical protein
MRDQVGQLGESEEYWMGGVRVVCVYIQSSEDGSPPGSIKDCISWASLQQASIMYWHIWGLRGLANLVAFTVTELDDTLFRFIYVQWDSVQATHGLPVEVFA